MGDVQVYFLLLKGLVLRGFFGVQVDVWGGGSLQVTDVGFCLFFEALFWVWAKSRLLIVL